MINKGELNEKQGYALDTMMNGQNVFLTGDAGTGKTTVIKMFIDEAEAAGKSVLVTATTGIAATNIGGGAMTIHRALEIPIYPDSYTKQVTTRRNLLRAADILVIDEISMCRFDLFNMIGKIVEYENYERAGDRMLCREDAREELQVVVTGDFHQLPPVTANKDREFLVRAYGPEYDARGKYGYGYAFLSAYWRQMCFEPIILDEVCRQDDPEFKKVLNDIKYGRNIWDAIDYLSKNTSKNIFPDAPFLVGKNAEADRINQNKMDSLETEEKVFNAQTSGEVTWQDLAQIGNSAKEELKLKIGARVMITVNAPDLSYVNGTIGTIRRFGRDEGGEYLSIWTSDRKTIDLHRTEWTIERQTVKTTSKTIDGKEVKTQKISREEVGKFTQFPVKLAWAISIHKSQGQTFSEINIDPYCWDPGQFYVAVSRAKSAKGICFIRPVKPNYIKAFSKENQKRLKDSFDGGGQ